MFRPILSSGLLSLLAAGFAGPTHPPAPAPASASLVSATWLAQHVRDHNLVILQVGPKEDYDKEHITGSRFVQLQDISTKSVPPALSLEMLPEDSLRAHLEALGISDGSPVVVVFTDEWVSPSTRVVYTLDYAGLGEHAMLLDGGLAAWKRAGLPVTAAVPATTRGHITRHIDPSFVVDIDYIHAHHSSPHVKLIDARTPEFYAGPPVHHDGPPAGDTPAGHIPGAANLPFNSLTDDSNQVLPLAQLQAKFRAAGVQPGDTVVAYCHIGQQATMVLFAARLLGNPVRLYDGSMQDWNQRKLTLEGGRP